MSVSFAVMHYLWGLTDNLRPTNKNKDTGFTRVLLLCGTAVWNSLPANLRDLGLSFYSFRTRLISHYFTVDYFFSMFIRLLHNCSVFAVRAILMFINWPVQMKGIELSWIESCIIYFNLNLLTCSTRPVIFQISSIPSTSQDHVIYHPRGYWNIWSLRQMFSWL